MKPGLKELLANRSKVGPAFWELAWLACADSEQVRLDEIAQALGKTERSVSRNLQHLANEGLIRITSQPWKVNRYAILLGEDGDAR